MAVLLCTSELPDRHPELSAWRAPVRGPLKPDLVSRYVNDGAAGIEDESPAAIDADCPKLGMHAEQLQRGPTEFGSVFAVFAQEAPDSGVDLWPVAQTGAGFDLWREASETLRPF